MAPEPGHEALLGSLREQIHDLSWRSRFTRIVPYVVPFLNAKSSTPRTLTFPTSSKGAALIFLSKVSRGHDAQLQGKSCSCSVTEFEGDRQQSLL
jgi:precorrin-4 methylase